MQEYAKLIDHTLLKADATTADIQKLAEEAKKYHFASVCVNPSQVPTAFEVLKDTPSVKVCTVIGFPLGATTTESKVFETKLAIQQGATEVDMVIHLGRLKQGDDTYVRNDIQAVVEEARGQALVKVILETCLLTEEQIVRVCKLAVQAGADFVKTSTGFSTGGATVEAVSLMRKTVGDQLGVKASGGIRSAADVKAMIDAGASRIGASAGVEIVTGGKSTTDY
ncbi:deoxyribose-phosphate aldolase [Shimazuella sp. AN120528]|uniref:deoxyribose-phosphate aldolase n=1 Tax=Shimazuella soli TaxID=1892854 RepID=UPI001F0F8680|nr:deoxyribose-phosphate aldolase [Shimazuella soli]MCH5586173.1 deoxyribose-phosphate aldolase [Shimazuella soli]